MTGISYMHATTGAKDRSEEEQPPQPAGPTAEEQEEADLLAAIQVCHDLLPVFSLSPPENPPLPSFWSCDFCRI